MSTSIRQADFPDVSDSKRMRQQFRRRMIAALLVLNIIAMMVVIFGLRELYERDIREVEIQSQNLSLAMDMTLTNEIRQIDITLRTIVAELEHHVLGKGQAQRILSQMIRQHKEHLSGVDAITVVSPEGKLIFHEGVPPSAHFDVSDREYFRDLKSGKAQGLVVSKPLKSRMTNQLILVFARAFRDNKGRFAGMVGVPLPLSYLTKLFSGFDVGKLGVLTVRSGDLSLITRIAPALPEVPSLPGDKKLTTPFQDLVRSGQRSGVYHAVMTFDQVDRVASYRQLDIVPIYVLVGIAKQDYLANWKNLCWISSGLLAFFLMVTNVSAYLLYRQWRKQRRYAGQLQTSLRQIQERDAALVSAQEAGGLGTYTLDISSGVWTSSAKLDEILGIDTTYPRNFESWGRFLREEDRKEVLAHFQHVLVGQKGFFDREIQIVRPHNGETCWVHALGKVELNANGAPIRVSGTIRDISERKRNEARLQLAREVFQNAAEGIVVTDKNGTILEVNPAFTDITGYSAEEAIGQNPRLLKSNVHKEELYKRMWEKLLDAGKWEGELVNRRKDGSTYLQWTRISAIVDGDEATRFTAVITDITELKESQQAIEYLAYYDKLTGLANRALLAERMRQAIFHAQRRGELLAVCYIDLDGFKPVNDEWGHEVGDRLLVDVGRRLQRNVRAGDTVARMGGDEFVLLLSGSHELKDIETAIARIIADQIEPFQIGQIVVTLSMSVGVTIYPHDAVEDADTLIRHADQAMYEAKRQGKNRMHFYDMESDKRLLEHQRRYVRIAEALAQGEFCLYYQPKVNMRTGAVAGVEALIRWQHPEKGLLPPQQFLPVIETTELTSPVGEWVLHEALKQKRQWRKQGIDLPVSINIFALHLQRADFVERLANILNDYPDVDPRGLEFEILETTTMGNLHEISLRIKECKKLGVRFSLDDFGTGYSSLTYLRELPVDIVKVDRSFVMHMLEDQEDQALVKSIVGMARTLGRVVVAEGVETIEHGLLLQECGCDLAQGYGIARPMPPEMFPNWLKQWSLPERWETGLS